MEDEIRDDRRRYLLGSVVSGGCKMYGTYGAVITAEFDLDDIAKTRREWGVFRDRRPEMYGTLITHGA